MKQTPGKIPSNDLAPSLREIRTFWDTNPLCSGLIAEKPGSPAFFREYDKIREENEPDDFIEQWLAPSRSKGLRVLDVGCGNGYMLAKFARAGARAVGIDLSARALDLTGKRMTMLDLTPGFLQGDSASLPFADEAFDLAYSLGVLHHSPETEKSFQEIYRVLRRGGRAVIMLYNKNSILYRLRIPAMKYFNPNFRGWSIQEICNHLDGQGNPLGKFYTRSDIKKMMKGFTDLRLSPFFFSHLHFPGKPDIFPGSLCRMLGKRFGWFLYASGVRR